MKNFSDGGVRFDHLNATDQQDEDKGLERDVAMDDDGGSGSNSLGLMIFIPCHILLCHSHLMIP